MTDRVKTSRSSIACNRCNLAKAKCDVASIGSPCSRCAARHLTDCEPIKSRRGTYDRKLSRLRRQSSAEGRGSDSGRTETTRVRDTQQNSSSSAIAFAPVSAAWSSVPAQPKATSTAAASTLATVSAAGTVRPSTSSKAADTTPAGTASSEPTSRSILSRLESSKSDIEDRSSATTISLNNDFSDTIPRPISTPHSSEAIGEDGFHRFLRSNLEPETKKQLKEWSRVFKGLFDNITYATASVNGSIPKHPLLYYGESFPASWLFSKGMTRNHCQIRLPRPRIMLSGPNDTGLHAISAEHPAHATPDMIAYLSSQQCFEKPSPSVLEELFSTYFEKTHHFYPIINRSEFVKLYEIDKIPWLLFHSICFAAASHCPIAALCRDGQHSSRREARVAFYKQAKALFDLSYEKNKIVLIQSALLLSFWGGEPDDYWNSVSWINMAVNIAESLGMHRALSSADLRDEDRTLWRRIWWCLVIRDSYCAALLGKPLRINLLQCDVEPLCRKDFESDDYPAVARLWGDKHTAYEEYLLESAKLSLILREIVQARDLGNVDTDFVLATHKAMQDWEAHMPDRLRVSTISQDSPLFVYGASLSLIYNHHLIYLHQTAPPECTLSDAVAQQAVTNIADFGSTLFMASVIPYIPQEVLASFFVAIVMIFTQIQRIKRGSLTVEQKTLFTMELKICVMIIHHAQDYWDHADWILAISEGLRHSFLESGSNAETGRPRTESNGTNTKDGMAEDENILLDTMESTERASQAPAQDGNLMDIDPSSYSQMNEHAASTNSIPALNMQHLIRQGVGSNLSMLGLSPLLAFDNLPLLGNSANTTDMMHVGVNDMSEDDYETSSILV
ncbi:fungal-specific transcription factor domain-containing protein [Lipomyces oligophaga]|uniref:fungal-specific transcription factor domain-containing protein n=1 Tax=Lipomyces oligophaga TaxID=45792 RepID=UPI0034CE2D25